MRLVFALACLISLLSPASSWADADDDDHDEAREAVEHGAILPLAQILARPELKDLGELVRVRLNRAEEHWTYRLRFVDANGHVREREVDAARYPKSDGKNDAHLAR